MDKQDQVRVEYMPLGKIVRAARNPKDHDLGTLHDSFVRFGFTQPLLINETTGRLVAGEGRTNTLQSLKAAGERPPGRIVERDGEWYVPVLRGIAFENEDEAQAYLMADNQLTILGGWNEQEEAEVLADLAAKGEEMLRGIGFDMDDVDELLRRLTEEKPAKTGEETEEEEVTEDQADALQEKWQVQPHDLWQIGPHAVFCGDSTENKSWQALLDFADLRTLDGGIFTSPPYAMQRADSRAGNYTSISPDAYVDWWKEGVARQAEFFINPDACFFVNIKNNVESGERLLYTYDLVTDMVRECGWHLIDEFCWERNTVPGHWPNRFKNGFEPVYQFALTTAITFRPQNVAEDRPGYNGHSRNQATGDYYNSTDFSWDTTLPSNRIPSFGSSSGVAHPAAFPIGLPEFFMRAFSFPNSTWLDPFSGSGTLAVAAHRNHRRALMIELEPKFVAVTLERLAHETGETPTKRSTAWQDKLEQ